MSLRARRADHLAVVVPLPVERRTRRSRLVEHLRANKLRWYIAAATTLSLASQWGIDGRLHVWIFG